MPNSIIFFCVLMLAWLALAIFENVMAARLRKEAQKATEEYFNSQKKGEAK